MSQSPFFTYNQDFMLFGTQHLIVMALMLFLCTSLPLYAKRYLNQTQQLWLSRGMALAIAIWALLYIVIKLWLGDFDYQTDLPFDICNIVALTLPFLMWNPSFRVHEIIYFWILAGTLQGIITPHLFNGFPNYIFFKYWFVHAGLVIYAIYTTVVFDLRPNWRSIWRSFLVLQAYVLFVLIINLMIGSNYIYVLRKPPTASALDYLGPWPIYLIVVEGIAIILFIILYLPVWVANKRRRS